MITLTNIRCMSESTDAFEVFNVDDSQLIIESYISSINEAGNDGGIWNKIKKVCGQIVDFITRIAKKIKAKIDKIVKIVSEKIKSAKGGKGKLEYYQLTVNDNHPGFRELTKLTLDQMFAGVDSSKITAANLFNTDDVKDAQGTPDRAKELAAAYNSILKNKEQFKFSPENEFWKKQFGIEDKETEYGTKSNVVSGKKTSGDRNSMLKSFSEFINRSTSAAERLGSVMETCRRRTANCIKTIETTGATENGDSAYVAFLQAKLTCISNYAGTFCSAATFLSNELEAAMRYCTSRAFGGEDSVSADFKNAVEKKNKLRVRIMLKDIMVVDPTMVSYNARIRYASAHMPDLFDQHDGEKLNYNKSAWTKEYLSQEMVTLVNNFSHERLALLEKMVPYIYKDDTERISNKHKDKIKNGKVDDDK